MINRYLDTPDIILPFYEEAARRLKGRSLKARRMVTTPIKLLVLNVIKLAVLICIIYQQLPSYSVWSALKILAGAILPWTNTSGLTGANQTVTDG